MTPLIRVLKFPETKLAVVPVTVVPVMLVNPAVLPVRETIFPLSPVIVVPDNV